MLKDPKVSVMLLFWDMALPVMGVAAGNRSCPRHNACHNQLGTVVPEMACCLVKGQD